MCFCFISPQFKLYWKEIVNLKLWRLFLFSDVLPVSLFLFNFSLGFFKHSTIFFCWCTFIPLFPVREGWRAECWRPTGLMKEVPLLQLGRSLASQGSREPQAWCQTQLDTTSVLIMWLSVLCVFKHSHLLYEVYCDFPLSIQGTAEAQTGHRLKTKPRFEAQCSHSFFYSFVHSFIHKCFLF